MKTSWLRNPRKPFTDGILRKVLDVPTVVFLLACAGSNPAWAADPTPAELAEAHQWASEHIGAASQALPFSFAYDGRPARGLLGSWARKIERQNLDSRRTQHRLIFFEPKTGLEVSCVAVEYADFPAVEWTVYFTNLATNNLPLLEEIQALDTRMGNLGETVLHHWRGDSNTPESYQPLARALAPGESKWFAPEGGRPSNGAFPYFNLQHPGGGRMLAVGWPGQWSATFTRELDGRLRLLAGQERVRVSLRPGEQIRTPLMVSFFWQGTDVVRAQNLWRRWMLEHNLPRPGGQPPAPMMAFCSGGFFEGLKVSEASERQFIDILAREHIRLDYWWMDAGWYPCDAWPRVGTWEPDPTRFPGGIKAVSDYAHGKGMKLILWFEPERVAGGTWLATNHPQWLLEGKLLNLGNPEARTWLTEHIDHFITEQGVDLYRQDFNMDPLELWRRHDAPDRQGLTENLHVQGYLAYWDELRRRHPGMLIDSCASGGRRNDLETLRRAVPLLRSDYQSFEGDPKFASGNQGHTYGLSSWIPYYGQGVYYNPEQYAYAVRSHFSPAFGMAVDARKKDIDWPLFRQLADQWRQVAGHMVGDYYPLTPYSLDEKEWIAWQFHSPKPGAGFVQAFRRSQSEEAGRTLVLRGLEPGVTYALTDLDTNTVRKMTGGELMQQGLAVAIKSKPGALLLRYEPKSGN